MTRHLLLQDQTSRMSMSPSDSQKLDSDSSTTPPAEGFIHDEILDMPDTPSMEERNKQVPSEEEEESDSSTARKHRHTDPIHPALRALLTTQQKFGPNLNNVQDSNLSKSLYAVCSSLRDPSGVILKFSEIYAPPEYRKPPRKRRKTVPTTNESSPSTNIEVDQEVKFFTGATQKRTPLVPHPLFTALATSSTIQDMNETTSYTEFSDEEGNVSEVDNFGEIGITHNVLSWESDILWSDSEMGVPSPETDENHGNMHTSSTQLVRPVLPLSTVEDFSKV